MKNDIFGTQIRTENSVILVMKYMLFKYNGCVLGIGIITRNYFGVKISENGKKTALPGDFWVNRVTATQTVNPLLFGKPMNCPDTIGADLGSPHKCQVVGSIKNIFCIILRKNGFRKSFVMFQPYLCWYFIFNKHV